MTVGLSRKQLLKSNPNESPSVHTIPEGVLVILIIFVKTGQIGIRQHS